MSGQTTATVGTVNFLTTLDGNVEGNAEITIDGVDGTLTSDENGFATINLPAGEYTFSASDAAGNTFSGMFTAVNGAKIDVAVTFRTLGKTELARSRKEKRMLFW